MARSTRAFAQPVSRRRFLHNAGIGLAAAALMGATGHRSLAAMQSGSITIPDPGVQLPAEDVTLRVVTNPEAAPYWNAFSTAYNAKHPNIEVAIDALNIVDIQETLSLGFRSETVHDLFFFFAGVTVPQAVQEGWLAPLDELIPNFEAWKATFPPNTFLEGVHMVEGKLYVFTASSPKRAHNLLLFNRPLLAEAGYDPAAATLSVDEYRDAARKVTERGNGQVYGVIIETQPNRLNEWVTDLAYRSGRIAVEDVDPKTGEYVYTSPEYQAAIEVLLALKSDGSLFPEFPARAQQAWARLPPGNAAMVTAGAWVVDTYNRDAPDFDFGVGTHPVMDKANALPQAYPADRLVEPYSIYAKTKLPAVAADTMSFLGSQAGQEAWGTITGGIGLPPILPEALARVREQTNEQGRATLAITEQIVAAPSPIVRNRDVALVRAEMRPIAPNLGETLQGILVGQISDVPAALQDLKDRAEQELDRAIEAARARGAQVSREDWIFPNWDPTRDYTQADYDAL